MPASEHSSARPHLAKGGADQLPHPGQTLRLILAEQGWSENGYAERIGVSATELRRMFVGERRVCCRRVDNGPRGVALAFHRARLALLDTQACRTAPVEASLLGVCAASGQLAGDGRVALADGEIGDAERVTLLRGVAKVEGELTTLRTTLRASGED